MFAENLKLYVMSNTKRLLEEVKHSKVINKHNLGDAHWTSVINNVRMLVDAEAEFYHTQQLEEELKMSKS